MNFQVFELKQRDFYLNTLIYRIVFLILGLLMFILGPIRKINKRAVPPKNGLLILANHRSIIDPVVVQLVCPRRVYFMAKKELFQIPILKAIIRFAKAFPVEQKTADRHAIRQAVLMLKQGKAVGIFPEGEMSETGELLPVLPGAALIAKLAGVPLICCGLKNTEKIMSYGSVIPHPSFSRLTAKWGEPKKFCKDTSIKEITDWIGSELQTLKQ